VSDESEETTTETAPEEPKADERLQVTVERTGPCECLIRIEAEAAYLQERYDEELQSLAQKATLPGFRQGKAPIGLVEGRLGASLRRDVIATVVSEAYDKAVEEHELAVVEQDEAPDLEKEDWAPGKPLAVEFRCQVMPTIELEEDQYKGLKVEAPQLELTEEMIERELERFAVRFASWEEVTEAGIDRDDYVEAEVALAGEDWVETIGFQPRDERIGPFSVAGLKGALLGAKAGDQAELEGEVLADGLDDWKGLEGLEGKGVSLSVKVQKVVRRRVPELDDELAKKIGMDSAEEIRSMVRNGLEESLQKQKEQLKRDLVVQRFVEGFDFELPQALLDRASKEQQRKLFLKMIRAGVSQEEAERRVSHQEEQNRETIQKALRSALALRELAKKETIYVTESEVDGQIRAFASRQGWREDRARTYLEQQGYVKSLRDDMRESKTVDLLLEHAEVSEIPLEEYERKHGAKQAGDARSAVVKEKEDAEDAEDSPEA